MSRATGQTVTARVRRQDSVGSRPGDHIAFIYEDTPELTAFVVPFIKEGLAKGERCVWLVDALRSPEAFAVLVTRGVDANREVERGALALLSAHEYFTLPPFDAFRVVAFLRRAVTEARAHGFTGLRIVAEMTWTLKKGPDGGALLHNNALLEWESLLELVVGNGPFTLACGFRRDRFPPTLLQRLIRTHAKVVVNDHVHLSLSALFQSLARTDLQGLARSAREHRVPKGEFYFHQEDPAHEVYVLTSGMVKLFRTDAEGRSVILRIIEPLESFGDRPVLAGTSRLASAQALEDSRALVWDAPTYLQTMVTHPAVSLNALRLLEDRIEIERSRLHDLATLSVERRLARLLLRLAQSMGRKTPRGVAIEVPLSGHDLADLTVSTPYSVSRILAGWRRRRIADARRERILVLDQQAITAIAGVRERGSV
jgi:CRP/FNR family transcriptional regulator, nitrogen oxide reductase regulator